MIIAHSFGYTNQETSEQGEGNDADKDGLAVAYRRGRAQAKRSLADYFLCMYCHCVFVLFC